MSYDDFNFTLPHWEYFLAIEEDLIRCSRFVEFSKSNFRCHSVEFARILLAACSEVDTLMKMVCREVEPTNSPENIDQYQPIITNNYPKFRSYKARLPRFGLSLIPWKGWKKNNPPKWWTANNKIKHQRDTSYRKANLVNTVRAVAGLFSILSYYYIATNKGSSPSLDYRNMPKVFSMWHDDPVGGGGIYGGFSTPDHP